MPVLLRAVIRRVDMVDGLNGGVNVVVGFVCFSNNNKIMRRSKDGERTNTGLVVCEHVCKFLS